jgi:hypothetical protein
VNAFLLKIPECFQEKQNGAPNGRPRRSVTFVKTLVKKTFGIDFEIANTRNDKMRFVADHWNDIVQYNHTFLSNSVDLF